MKKLTICLLLVSLFVATIFGVAACDDKGELWIDKLDITAVIDKDGNAHIVEDWSVGINAEEPYRNFYRTISVIDNSNGDSVMSQICDLKVYDVDNGVNLNYASVSNPYNYKGELGVYYLYQANSSENEIGVFVEGETDGVRNFTVSYTLTDLAAKYNDTGVIYWRILDSSETFIGECDIKIYFDSDVPVNNGAMWLHSVSKDAKWVKNANGYEVNIPKVKNDSLEIRCLFDKDFLGSNIIKSYDSDAIQKIETEENQWIAEYEEELKREKLFAVINITILVVCVALAIAIVIYFKVFYYKTKKDLYPEYIRDIPAGYTPAEMGHLFYYYDGGFANSKKARNNMLSATILDLCRKHFIEIDPIDEEKYAINVKNISEAQLMTLKAFERPIFELLRDVQAHYNRAFTMEEFEDFSKDNVSRVDTAIRNFRDESRQKFFNAKWVGKQQKWTSVLAPILTLTFAGSMYLFTIGSSFALALVGIMVLSISTILAMPKYRKLNKEGEKEYATLEGLERYMLHFSNLKEYEIPQLILWEEYMVYATMMGIAEEVLEELKVAYPELTNPSYYTGYVGHNYFYTYLWLSRGGRCNISTNISKSFDSISNTITSLSNPVKISGSSSSGKFGGFSSSGGGFRGGGGGFGGGSFGGRH